MSNKNSISYRQIGDYLIPNLALPHEEANITLGKWGMLHKDYLEKHNRVFLTCCSPKGSCINTVQMLKIRQERYSIHLWNR